MKPSDLEAMGYSDQLLLPLDLPPVLSSGPFCVGPSNQEAFSWIQRWPNWPQRCLVLYGPEGCGKTHLGHIWQQHVQGKWIDLDGCDQRSPTEWVLENPALVLDDAHLFQDEVYLFHLYNAVQEYRGWLLLLAPFPPAHWDIRLADLASRLKILPTIEILLPDDALLQGVIQKLFNDLQICVDQEVITFMVQHMERSFSGARNLVEFLNQASLRLRKSITLAFVREQWRIWNLQQMEED